MAASPQLGAHPSLGNLLRASRPDTGVIIAQLRRFAFRPEEARELLGMSRRPGGGMAWLRVLAEEAKVFPLNREGHRLLLWEMLAAVREELTSAASLHTMGEDVPLLEAFVGTERRSAPPGRRFPAGKAEQMLKIFGWYMGVFEQKYGSAALAEALARFPAVRDRLLRVLRRYKPSLKITECPVCLEPVTPSEDVGLACGHALHTECARGLRKAECPYCRGPFAGLRLRITPAELEEMKRRERVDREAIAGRLTRQLLLQEAFADFYVLFDRGRVVTRVVT